MILAESPRRQRVTKLVSWGHWFALANILIALIISSIFVFSSPLPDTLMGSGYLFANWFGHISFMTFFGFVIFVLPLCYWVTHERLVKGLASVFAASGLALLAFDALLFNKTGVHISFGAADLVKVEAENQMSQFSWQQWGYLALLFVIWLGFQLVLANAIWKRLERLYKFKIGIPLSSFFTLCFVSSHVIHVWADAELYQPIIQQDSMFPLSYPATAKTTMSKYGLLDIQRYKERKQLQFDPHVYQINYPTQPIYCSINPNQNVQVVIQTDTVAVPDISLFDLRRVKPFYTGASTTEGTVVSTLYGVPEIYQNSLTTTRPVLFELTQAMGMNIGLSVPEGIQLSEPLKAYTGQPASNENVLQVSFLTGDQITEWLQPSVLASNTVIIVTKADSTNLSAGSLYTNLNVKTGAASLEDVAPTILNALGCMAPTSYYSTGQNLLSPSRRWLVTTSGEKIVVVDNQQLTEVLSNGSHEITDLTTGQRSTEALDVDMLSQAIKHLTRFSNAN